MIPNGKKKKKKKQGHQAQAKRSRCGTSIVKASLMDQGVSRAGDQRERKVLSWQSGQEDSHVHFLVGVGDLCGLGHTIGHFNVFRDPATTGRLETTQKIKNYRDVVSLKSLTLVQGMCPDYFPDAAAASVNGGIYLSMLRFPCFFCRNLYL